MKLFCAVGSVLGAAVLVWTFSGKYGAWPSGVLGQWRDQIRLETVHWEAPAATREPELQEPYAGEIWKRQAPALPTALGSANVELSPVSRQTLNAGHAVPPPFTGVSRPAFTILDRSRRSARGSSEPVARLVQGRVAREPGAGMMSLGLIRAPSLAAELPASLIIVGAGQRLQGNRWIAESVKIQSGGVISPGNSPGHLTTGFQNWGEEGIYDWEINDVDAGAGTNPGWDLVTATGLSITATDQAPFTVKIISLSLGATEPPPGSVHDFNSSQTYSWRILGASFPVEGFDLASLAIDSTAFQNPLNGGAFSLSLGNGGRDVLLNFTPVPEPHEYALAIGAGLVVFAVFRNRRRGRMVRRTR